MFKAGTPHYVTNPDLILDPSKPATITKLTPDEVLDLNIRVRMMTEAVKLSEELEVPLDRVLSQMSQV